MNETAERTFSFVDLAGFTALTEAHGDADAVALLNRFLVLARESLSDQDELVKSIGDAVMLASSSPGAALQTLALIWERCGSACGFPLPRVGAHHGRAIARDSDYLGASVNLASRIAGHAGGGQVLVTQTLVEPARENGLKVVALGAHRLHNLTDPVEIFEVRLFWGEPADTIDPVCRMLIDQESAAGSLRDAGKHFWFCSLACAAPFAASPDRYLPSGTSYQ